MIGPEPVHAPDQCPGGRLGEVIKAAYSCTTEATQENGCARLDAVVKTGREPKDTEK